MDVTDDVLEAPVQAWALNASGPFGANLLVQGFELHSGVRFHGEVIGTVVRADCPDRWPDRVTRIKEKKRQGQLFSR